VGQDCILRGGLQPPPVGGRKISEVIAAMKASGANAVVDEDFAREPAVLGLGISSSGWPGRASPELP